MIRQNVARPGVRDSAVLFLQCFGELPKLFKLVANAKDFHLLQESQVVLNGDEQLLHLAISAKEHSASASPDALSAVVVLFRAGFSKDVPQFSKCLLALLENRFNAFAVVLGDPSILEVLVGSF